MEKLKQRLEELQPRRVLDVGTGAGNFIYRMNEEFETTYIGIDTSDKAINAARDHFKEKEHISFKVMDAENMEFEDETFDIVTLSNTLHHLKDETPIFTEMLRVLKPSGYILINEMQSDDLHPMQESHKLIHHFAAKIDRMFGVEHKETFTRDTIFKMMEKWGSVEEISEEVKLKEKMTEEEFAWYQRLIGRVVERAKDLDNYDELRLEAEKLVDYVKENGYDNATSVTALIKK